LGHRNRSAAACRFCRPLTNCPVTAHLCVCVCRERGCLTSALRPPSLTPRRPAFSARAPPASVSSRPHQKLLARAPPPPSRDPAPSSSPLLAAPSRVRPRPAPPASPFVPCRVRSAPHLAAAWLRAAGAAPACRCHRNFVGFGVGPATVWHHPTGNFTDANGFLFCSEVRNYPSESGWICGKVEKVLRVELDLLWTSFFIKATNLRLLYSLPVIGIC
jgi:hypothetical protein